MSPQEARGLRRTLYLAAFLRALAIGLMAVLIGLYAARLGLSAQQIGIILSCALWGAALAALFTLVAGSRVHERTLLVTLCTLPVLGAAIFLASEDFKVLAAAAFVGMFNVHGRDRGAIPILEQAIFPTTVNDAERTKTFAWYNVLLDAGYATGGLLAALPALLEVLGLDTLQSMRASLALFCVLYGAAGILYARLPRHISGVAPVTLGQLSPKSRPIVAKISFLFLIDAFGGGFIGSALLAYFFAERFGVPAAQVAVLFAVRARALGVLAPRGRVACKADRAHQHDGVHAHPDEPPPLHHRRDGRFLLGRVLLPAARGDERDGCPDAPVVRHGGGRAARAPRGFRNHEPRALLRLGDGADARGRDDDGGRAGAPAHRGRHHEDQLRLVALARIPSREAPEELEPA
jgi:MFS family permease